MGFFDFIKQFIGSNKKNVQIIANDFTKIYKGSEALEIGLYCNNEPLSNKIVTIEINNKSYERKTNDDGIVKLNINLSVGKYRTLINFKGDDEYKSAKTYIDVYVNPIIETSDLNMSEKDGSKFIAKIKDNENNLLSNIGVIFEINGKQYTRTTNEEGKIELKINLNQGQYNIKTIINNISKTNIINIAPPITNPPSNKHFGYWIFGKDMLNVDINHLKERNVTDLFLNYYAFEAHGEEKVLSWIRNAKELNINTHIWMQCFYDGEWHNPKTTNLIEKVQEAERYASIEDVYGIHLDYLRYPGNAYKTDDGDKAINAFVKEVKDVIGNKFLSCAIMPESDNVRYYGQDAEALGKIVDAILPMQYKGNYQAGQSWLASTTKNFSNKATIWSGLQSYKSDDDTTILSDEELMNDINTCLNNGAQGAILFRYGLSSDIDFPSNESSNKKPTRMEGIDVNMTYKDGTQYQCAVYDENGRISVPVNLTINGQTYNRKANNEGLYKLNINLEPGNYTLKASFAGNDTYLGSSIINNITVNGTHQEEPKSEPTELYDYFTNQGGGYLGQKTPYSCGPHSLMQCIYRLTGEDVSEMELASAAGTTTNGTDHEGLATALNWFNRKYGYNLKMTWKNFSEVGFEGTQQLIDNGACFHHILYMDAYGHYEVPKWTKGDPIDVLNSLGSQCGNGYCGYVESRSRSKHQGYIDGISQPSVCIITR